jgi:heptosyltransferase-2
VLLGGPGDRGLAEEILADLGLPVLDLVGKTNLRQALGVLRHLGLLVGNDSGLMHAAAALGVPVIAIYGSTDPWWAWPFTDRATVFYRPRPCSPCVARTCDIGYACLTDITVADVAQAARGWLE